MMDRLTFTKKLRGEKESEKNYFVQYPDISMIDAFILPKGVFKSIDIGISDIEANFLLTFLQNTIDFPIFFVLDSVILDHVEENILESISPYQFAPKGFIIKVNSVNTLKTICENTVDLVLNGLSVFIFSGKSIYEEDLVPTRNLNTPIEFKRIDFEKIETLINVHEVGLTIFTKNDKYNSPKKIIHLVPKSYSLDMENSDI